MESNHFLNCESLLTEIKSHYNFDDFINKNVEEQQSIITQYVNEIENSLMWFIDSLDQRSENYYLEFFSYIGPKIEFLLKVCLLKSNWKNSGKITSKYFGLNEAFQEIIKENEGKLNDTQIKRLNFIKNLISIQRNYHLHRPFKGFYHYALYNQIFQFILLLNKFYDLGFGESLNNKLKSKSYSTDDKALDFEDVGILTIINGV